MSRQTIEHLLHVSRRDVGRQLFHFTRRQEANTSTGTPSLTALDRLKKILVEQSLIGSSGFVKGGHLSVSFTEAPITELASLFAIANSQSPETLRYEPYGIAVTKQWLFAHGGRPVIYQPDSEFNLLPESLQWRHVRYEPPQVDFTWEREWRVKTGQLSISPIGCLVVVRTAQEAHDINYSYSQLAQQINPRTGVNLISSTATWMAVSLDFFGV